MADRTNDQPTHPSDSCHFGALFRGLEHQSDNCSEEGVGQTRRYRAIAIFAAMAESTTPTSSSIGGTISDCSTVM